MKYFDVEHERTESIGQQSDNILNNQGTSLGESTLGASLVYGGQNDINSSSLGRSHVLEHNLNDVSQRSQTVLKRSNNNVSTMSYGQN
jgi:hypothetical protein